MPIVAADLICYGAASRPSDDVSTVGGAIDTLDRPDLTQFTANAVAAVVSDGADTRTVTVQGRLASTGVVDTEALVLNGTTEVVGAKTWERLLTVTVGASSGTRTITVRQGSGGSTRATILPNETSRTAVFRQSTSEGATALRYEKVFWKNTHGSLTLLVATVTLTADPDARVRMGIATSVNDTQTATNRKTAPSGITFVDDNVSQSVPASALAAGERIGVWVEQNLPAQDPPHRTTFTTQLAGSTA